MLQLLVTYSPPGWRKDANCLGTKLINNIVHQFLTWLLACTYITRGIRSFKSGMRHEHLLLIFYIQTRLIASHQMKYSCTAWSLYWSLYHLSPWFCTKQSLLLNISAFTTKSMTGVNCGRRDGPFRSSWPYLCIVFESEWLALSGHCDLSEGRKPNHKGHLLHTVKWTKN